MAAASSRSLPNLASVELDEITWTNEVIKAQQWSCYSPSACQWLQPSPTAMVQSGQLYHIDDNDYCCPYSSDHIPPTATVSCVTYQRTVKLGNKEWFDKEQIGIKEPFPVTNLPFTL